MPVFNNSNKDKKPPAKASSLPPKQQPSAYNSSTTTPAATPARKPPQAATPSASASATPAAQRQPPSTPPPRGPTPTTAQALAAIQTPQRKAVSSSAKPSSAPTHQTSTSTTAAKKDASKTAKGGPSSIAPNSAFDAMSAFGTAVSREQLAMENLQQQQQAAAGGAGKKKKDASGGMSVAKKEAALATVTSTLLTTTTVANGTVNSITAATANINPLPIASLTMADTKKMLQKQAAATIAMKRDTPGFRHEAKVAAVINEKALKPTWRTDVEIPTTDVAKHRCQLADVTDEAFDYIPSGQEEAHLNAAGVLTRKPEPWPKHLQRIREMNEDDRLLIGAAEEAVEAIRLEIRIRRGEVGELEAIRGTQQVLTEVTRVLQEVREKHNAANNNSNATNASGLVNSPSASPTKTAGEDPNKKSVPNANTANMMVAKAANAVTTEVNHELLSKYVKIHPTECVAVATKAMQDVKNTRVDRIRARKGQKRHTHVFFTDVFRDVTASGFPAQALQGANLDRIKSRTGHVGDLLAGERDYNDAQYLRLLQPLKAYFWRDPDDPMGQYAAQLSDAVTWSLSAASPRGGGGGAATGKGRAINGFGAEASVSVGGGGGGNPLGSTSTNPLSLGGVGGGGASAPDRSLGSAAFSSVTTNASGVSLMNAHNNIGVSLVSGNNNGRQSFAAGNTTINTARNSTVSLQPHQLGGIGGGGGAAADPDVETSPLRTQPSVAGTDTTTARSRANTLTMAAGGGDDDGFPVGMIKRVSTLHPTDGVGGVGAHPAEGGGDPFGSTNPPFMLGRQRGESVISGSDYTSANTPHGFGSRTPFNGGSGGGANNSSTTTGNTNGGISGNGAMYNPFSYNGLDKCSHTRFLSLLQRMIAAQQKVRPVGQQQHQQQVAGFANNNTNKMASRSESPSTALQQHYNPAAVNTSAISNAHHTNNLTNVSMMTVPPSSPVGDVLTTALGGARGPFIGDDGGPVEFTAEKPLKLLMAEGAGNAMMGMGGRGSGDMASTNQSFAAPIGAVLNATNINTTNASFVSASSATGDDTPNTFNGTATTSSPLQQQPHLQQHSSLGLSSYLGPTPEELDILATDDAEQDEESAIMRGGGFDTMSNKSSMQSGSHKSGGGIKRGGAGADTLSVRSGRTAGGRSVLSGNRSLRNGAGDDHDDGEGGEGRGGASEKGTTNGIRRADELISSDPQWRALYTYVYNDALAKARLEEDKEIKNNPMPDDFEPTCVICWSQYDQLNSKFGGFCNNATKKAAVTGAKTDADHQATGGEEGGNHQQTPPTLMLTGPASRAQSPIKGGTAGVPPPSRMLLTPIKAPTATTANSGGGVGGRGRVGTNTTPSSTANMSHLAALQKQRAEEAETAELLKSSERAESGLVHWRAMHQHVNIRQRKALERAMQCREASSELVNHDPQQMARIMASAAQASIHWKLSRSLSPMPTAATAGGGGIHAGPLAAIKGNNSRPPSPSSTHHLQPIVGNNGSVDNTTSSSATPLPQSANRATSVSYGGHSSKNNNNSHVRPSAAAIVAASKDANRIADFRSDPKYATLGWSDAHARQFKQKVAEEEYYANVNATMLALQQQQEGGGGGGGGANQQQQRQLLAMMSGGNQTPARTPTINYTKNYPVAGGGPHQQQLALSPVPNALEMTSGSIINNNSLISGMMPAGAAGGQFGNSTEVGVGGGLMNNNSFALGNASTNTAAMTMMGGGGALIVPPPPPTYRGRASDNMSTNTIARRRQAMNSLWDKPRKDMTMQSMRWYEATRFWIRTASLLHALELPQTSLEEEIVGDLLSIIVDERCVRRSMFFVWLRRTVDLCRRRQQRRQSMALLEQQRKPSTAAGKKGSTFLTDGGNNTTTSQQQQLGSFLGCDGNNTTAGGAPAPATSTVSSDDPPAAEPHVVAPIGRNGGVVMATNGAAAQQNSTTTTTANAMAPSSNTASSTAPSPTPTTDEDPIAFFTATRRGYRLVTCVRMLFFISPKALEAWCRAPTQKRAGWKVPVDDGGGGN